MRYWQERRIARLVGALRMTRGQLGRLPAETVESLLVVHEATEEAMRNQS